MRDNKKHGPCGGPKRAKNNNAFLWIFGGFWSIFGCGSAGQDFILLGLFKNILPARAKFKVNLWWWFLDCQWGFLPS